MSLKPTSSPSGLAVSLPLAREQCRVHPDDTSEDTLITLMINAATQHCQALLGGPILSQQWRLTLDSWTTQPRADVMLQIYAAVPQWRPAADILGASTIRLRCPRITSIDAVQYVAADTGTLTTLASTEWAADLGELATRLAPAYGKAWPSARAQLGAVQIDFTAGWAANAVPAHVQQWLLLRTASLYQHREDWTLGKPIERNEWMDCLLDGAGLVAV